MRPNLHDVLNQWCFPLMGRDMVQWGWSTAGAGAEESITKTTRDQVRSSSLLQLGTFQTEGNELPEFSKY